LDAGAVQEQQQYQQQQAQQYLQQYQLQVMQQQYQQQQPGGGYEWPNMPRSAGDLQGGQGYGPNTAVSSNSGASQAGSGSGQTPPVQLSTAQRYRQARSNQVVPIPEEYLMARNMPVQD
jgi:hypothetical protein